ncbi:MAG: hypothetical protein IBX62_05105 [Coriobacteriia bacterium]|nr:hypothetical protein [Coriobacteriia bacterium]
MPRVNGGNAAEYRESDMRLLLHERGDWDDWVGPIRYLHAHGGHDPDIKPSFAQRMMVDLERLYAEGVPFTKQPGEAYRLARGRRRGGWDGARRRVMPYALQPPFPRGHYETREPHKLK